MRLIFLLLILACLLDIARGEFDYDKMMQEHKESMARWERAR